jgi:hypothetical protein
MRSPEEVERQAWFAEWHTAMTLAGGRYNDSEFKRATS